MLNNLTDVIKPSLTEISVQYSNIYNGKDFGRYNPDDLIIKKGNKVYTGMLSDEQVKATLVFKKYFIISREYNFDISIDEEGNENPQHKEMADFFLFMLGQINGNFSDKMYGILSAIENGYSVCEKVYKPVTFNGVEKWAVKDIKLRPFDSFNGGFICDPHGNIQELRQISIGSTNIQIPMDKIIHYVYQADKDTCYGESDLRAAYRAWFSKDIAIKFLNIFLERSASGFPVFTKEGKLTEGQQTTLEKMASRISAFTAFILPKNIKLEWQMPKNNGMFEQAITIYDKAIAKAIMVPNLLGLSEQGNTGSYAQSQTHIDVFSSITDSIANSLAETLNEQLFKQLAVWNFGTEDFPKFKFNNLSADAKSKLALAWGQLISNGAVTKSPTDEYYIRKILGFPAKEDVEEVNPVEVKPGLPEEEETPDEKPDQDEWLDKKENSEGLKLRLSERPWLARMNFKEMEKGFDVQDEVFGQSLSDILVDVKYSLINQVTKIAGQRSWGNVKSKEIQEISIPKNLLSAIRKNIRQNLTDTLEVSYNIAKKELPKAKLAVNSGVMDKMTAERFLSSKAVSETKVIDDSILKDLQRVLETAITYDYSLRDTIKALTESTALASMLPLTDSFGRAVNVPARIETIVRTLNATAWNQARTSLYNDPEIKDFIMAFEYVAILDSRTSDICNANDGKIRTDWGSWTPPNHYNCRSMLSPVTTIDDWAGKQDALTQAGQPLEGFGQRLK